MKKLHLFCKGIFFASLVNAQPSFQTSLEAGIALPLSSNEINGTHAGKAIHFGNHLDYSFGNNALRFGLGAYLGYINAVSTDGKYKAIGEAIAEKYRFAPSQLSFNAAPFKSAHILIGPVASFGSGNCTVNLWAKAGYGLNEPSSYAVQYKENGVSNNIYSNRGGDNKNGLAYNLGIGLTYALSDYVGLQLSAACFGTQTDQINYNFDREKGTAPLYSTAANQFIQASAGIQFSIGNLEKRSKPAAYSADLPGVDTGAPVARDQKIKTKSNIKNDRLLNNTTSQPEQMVLKIKTKSNIKNDRLAVNNNAEAADEENDSLFFLPANVQLRSAMPVTGNGRIQLQAVDNYLTGFVYQGQNGAMISQCGSNAMPGEPIPGIDVRLRRTSAPATEVMVARTNRDGSFAFNNIVPGNYTAEMNGTASDITVNGNKDNAFQVLDIADGSCGNSKENYIITTGNKTYVEVISSREAGSGLATGKKHISNIKYNDINVAGPRDAATGQSTSKRMHRPYRVTDMEFDVNMDNIIRSDARLYAEVIAAREAGSGMAAGRRTVLVTGDVDGDGIPESSQLAAPDLATRKHVANIKWTPGLSTGRRMHKPFVITKELDRLAPADGLAPRDAASGLATGKRMHKPLVIRFALDEDNEIIAPRDAATGMASGRRMHKPYTISIAEDGNSYEIISPRDAASGLPTGKRMHKPFVITHEMGYNEAGNEVVIYSIVHRDPAARTIENEEDMSDQILSPEAEDRKGIITGTDNEHGYTTDKEEQAVANNPLYEPSAGQANNPLFEGRQKIQVPGSNGKMLDIFIPVSMLLNTGAEQAVAANTDYAVMPLKWMAPESISRETAAAKGITEKGIKRTAAAEQNAGNAARKGWDGSVKGSEKIVDASARKGWDGTVKGGSKLVNISRVHCADGTCVVDALVEVDGVQYESVISGVMTTKQGIAKGLPGN